MQFNFHRPHNSQSQTLPFLLKRPKRQQRTLSFFSQILNWLPVPSMATATFTSSSEPVSIGAEAESLIVADKKYFSCKICSCRFRSNQYLQIHQRKKHTKERPFACSICTNRFYEERTLKTHLLKEHPASEAANQVLQQRQQYQSHWQFNCTHCNKRFKTEPILNSHKLKFHSKPVRNLCELCGNDFSSVRILKRHQKEVHLGSIYPRFNCFPCSYKTLRWANFSRHCKGKKHKKVIKLLPDAKKEVNYDSAHACQLKRIEMLSGPGNSNQKCRIPTTTGVAPLPSFSISFPHLQHRQYLKD